ncbi:MAG: response regulator [Spirochaetia bacterium]|nr:response regulator [Spirochaetia bacterium]
MNSSEKIKSGRVLIVDDNQINVILIEKILKNAGYQNITTTTDSTKVTELYKQNKYDLILLDIRMPNMDGFEVMSQLKKIENESYLPIIVLTADSERDVRIKALEEGAKDFLTKPIDQLEALTRIQNLLEVRLLHNQVRDYNKTLEEKVLERTKELRNTRLEIIQRLTKASEYRDNETGNHIIRISRYSEIMAKSMNMPNENVEYLLNASPMHDVGKIGISDNILLKPGKLTKEEFETMKKHTTIGYDIISNTESKLLKIAAEIALTHHEKWDGSGYPHGKKKEEIPLEGRIVAICDVYDALTSERPYKEAWPSEKALEEILSLREIHFDPEITDIFKNNIDKIIKIEKEYKDK